jgi:hypothetical protein
LNTGNKYLRFGVKLLFGLAVAYFVGWKVYQMFLEGTYKGPFETQYIGIILSTVSLLMILNWSVEAVKWKSLMERLNPITFKAAVAGVLAGISTGLITPNRLGNFIGRTQLIDKELRTKAALLTFLSNLSQFVPSILFGCLSLLYVTSNYYSAPQVFIFITGVLLLLAALALYINPTFANRKPLNYLFTDKIKEAITFTQAESLALKIKLLAWSALRYLVFVTQYVLLLVLFNQNLNLLILFANVSVVYLLMTIIPGLLFGKLFVREAAALLVLGQLGIPDLIILTTGFLLWLINIALPSLIGTIILLRKK